MEPHHPCVCKWLVHTSGAYTYDLCGRSWEVAGGRRRSGKVDSKHWFNKLYETWKIVHLGIWGHHRVKFSDHQFIFGQYIDLHEYKTEPSWMSLHAVARLVTSDTLPEWPQRWRVFIEMIQLPWQDACDIERIFPVLHLITLSFQSSHE